MSIAAETHDGPAACENCSTPLQGRYCHQCGQTAHNPLRHFGHAVEDVFESFWHLDGRIFRTLRDLWSPGRLANRYLAGHRAPYIAPLRLFVVLSVLTFFVAQYAVSLGPDIKIDGKPVNTGTAVVDNAFRDEKTVDEVIQSRDEAVRALEEGKSNSSGIPGMDVAMDRSIEAMREQARVRIAEIDPQHPELKKADVATTPITRTASVKTGFADRWAEKKVERAKENLDRFSKEPDLFKRAMLSSIPTALFFLVPIFAAFLKLAYIETSRGYLEHLVVALFSHAWLCLALLVMWALIGLDAWISPHAPWFGVVIGVLEFFLWAWMPIYLLMMQKRVYAQAWWLTVLKYCVIGTVYLVLVAFGASFIAIGTVFAG